MASRDSESERPAGSNGRREKKRGSQEPQPRLGTRRLDLAVEPAQLERAIGAPSIGPRCVHQGRLTGKRPHTWPLSCASGAMAVSFG